MQDYKSLCAAVTICATLVNIQTDTQTAFYQLIWIAQPAELTRQSESYTKTWNSYRKDEVFKCFLKCRHQFVSWWWPKLSLGDAISSQVQVCWQVQECIIVTTTKDGDVSSYYLRYGNSPAWCSFSLRRLIQRQTDKQSTHITKPFSTKFADVNDTFYLLCLSRTLILCPVVKLAYRYVRRSSILFKRRSRSAFLSGRSSVRLFRACMRLSQHRKHQKYSWI